MERARPRPPSEEDPSELLASAGVLLCPYCKGALLEGTLAGACEGCNTLHHVSCFAEHRGCSTHGCASTHARSLRVGSPAPVDFPGYACAVCKKQVERDALVARCACGRVLDTTCFETIGACGAPACTRPVRLLGHAEAVAERARASARILEIVSVGLLVVAGGTGALPWLTTVGPHDRIALVLTTGLVGFFGLLFGWLAWGQRRRAVSLEQLPPPRPPGEGREATPAKV